jgi:hypothetical protein
VLHGAVGSGRVPEHLPGDYFQDESVNQPGRPAAAIDDARVAYRCPLIARSGRWQPSGCADDRTQNIQFGMARADRLGDQVAEHIGG